MYFRLFLLIILISLYIIQPFYLFLFNTIKTKSLLTKAIPQTQRNSLFHFILNGLFQSIFISPRNKSHASYPTAPRCRRKRSRCIIRKSNFSPNPKRSVRKSNFHIKRSVLKTVSAQHKKCNQKRLHF